ncbi:MAG: hypothetical protein ACK5XT_01830 [Gemmatimonas sp.]|uniref:hypothetical protein n=1 Tax=Gemmatimonas sp. TaxID=1962908 RepID=UPI00391FC231|nr:hypothetical protein [Gemmatimonadota bacterium]
MPNRLPRARGQQARWLMRAGPSSSLDADGTGGWQRRGGGDALGAPAPSFLAGTVDEVPARARE